jgi:hypothetical protein
MSKSRIHIRPVSAGSETHNQRLKELNYVRADLSQDNESYIVDSIANVIKDIETRYRNSRGQKMQAKATPIREGVLLIEKHHTIDDLKRLGDRLEKEFGIKTIQAYTHKDEGHWSKETGEWKPNYHAHMVFNWTDEKGKNLNLKRPDMEKMQTIVAEELGLERGKKSGKDHITARAFKLEKLEESISKTYQIEKRLPGALEIIETSRTIEKELKPLREEKKALEFENTLLRSNVKFLDEKNEALREENKKLEQEQNKYRGFSR